MSTGLLFHSGLRCQTSRRSLTSTSIGSKPSQYARPIAQRANLLDLHHYLIPILHPQWRFAAHPHTKWRAGADQVAWLQGHELADVRDQVRHVEDHVVRIGALHHLAIQGTADRQSLRVRNIV